MNRPAANHYAAHMSHCDQGEYAGVCKYGDDAQCPALAAARDLCMTEFEARLGLGPLDREPSERRRAIAAAANLLRSAGWTCKPPPDPNAPCGHCGKPAHFHGPCPFGGCPLGADL